MTKEDGVRTRVDGAPAVAGPDRLLTYYAQALQASEGRFRTLIDRTIDGVLVLRRDGTVCFVNPAAEALLGRPARALVGAMFGIPLTPGAAAEVDIIRGRDQPGVAE